MKNYQKKGIALIFSGFFCLAFLGSILKSIDRRFYRSIYAEYYLEYIIPLTLIILGSRILMLKKDSINKDSTIINETVNIVKDIFLAKSSDPANNLNNDNLNPKRIVNAGKKFLIGLITSLITSLVCFITIYFNGYYDSKYFVIVLSLLGSFFSLYMYLSFAIDLIKCQEN